MFPMHISLKHILFLLEIIFYILKLVTLTLGPLTYKVYNFDILDVAIRKRVN